jgi:signal transduction histidine kinase
MKLESYISTPIWFEGKIFGTLNFSSTKIREKGFSDEEVSFIEILAQAMSYKFSIDDKVYQQNKLIEDLEAQKRIAEEATRAKSQFLANMSHELRTPLNGIIGYADLLLEDVEDLDDDIKSDLDKIKQSGVHLLGLINQILDLSKVEAGKMDVFPTRFSVEGTVEKIATIVRPMIEKNRNDFEIDMEGAPEFFTSDLEKYNQIVINLLSNAAKFTSEGLVKLRVSEQVDNGTHWLVTVVRDSGIGIPKDKLQSIFHEFTQVDGSTRRRYAGTGLGLSICNEFAHLLGGHLAVESREGKGAVFTLRLPVR